MGDTMRPPYGCDARDWPSEDDVGYETDQQRNDKCLAWVECLQNERLIDKVNDDAKKNHPCGRIQAFPQQRRALLRIPKHPPEIWRAAAPSVPEAIQGSDDGSHQWLHNEAKFHRSAWPLDQVVPDAFHGAHRKSMPYGTGNDQQRADRDNQFGEYAQSLGSGVRHVSWAAALATHLNRACAY